MAPSSTAFGLLGSIIQAQREVMACGPDLPRIMDLVAEHAQALTDAQGAAVELREADRMVYRGVSGSAESARGLSIPVQESLSGQCALRGEAQICHDTEHDERVNRDACRKVGVRSMVLVPLQSQGNTLGVLKVISSEPSAFNAGDVTTLEIIAGFVAEAIAHAKVQEEARRQFELFEGAFKHAAIGMALVGLDGRFLRVNDALCQMVGYDRDDLIALTFQHITHPDDLQNDVTQLDRLRRGEIESYALEKRYAHRLGSQVWIHLTVTAVRDAAQNAEYYVAQVHDITPRKLAESEAFAFFEMSPDLLAISRGGNLEAVNGAWETKLGFTKDELTSQPFLAFVHPDDRANVELVNKTLEGGGPITNFRHRCRTHDGSYRWLEWNTRSLVDGRHYSIARDITSQVEHEAELQQLATIDSLTGLHNRRSFALGLERAVEEESQRGGSLACLLLDIDHFKSINDEQGHAAGDEVLRRFARVMRACLREGDMLGRWGGEEFAIVLRGMTSADFVSVAERIRRTCVETQMVSSDPTWRVTVSIGIAELDVGDTHPGAIVERADEALYKAKEGGRNRVCVSPRPSKRAAL